MSELRLDPTTREWVVIAPERGERPHEFPAPVRREPELFLPSCPFCPGNESQTAGEIASYMDTATGRWRVRVFENKYPAVHPDGAPERSRDHPLAVSVTGVGKHEVVVESAFHYRPIAQMGDDEVFDVVRAYRDRLQALSSIDYVRQVVIFKNHGPAAGTSLQHPHSQIVAMPVVPLHRRHQYDVAVQYHDEHGHNLLRDIAEFELERGVRVVSESSCFVEVHPYASRQPFETWLLPKTPRASFGDVPDDDLHSFGCALRDALRRLFVGLHDPDFNHILYTAASGDEDEPYYCWHLRIYPRLTAVAGFEIGSGIHINSSRPEETARFMRDLAHAAN